VLKFKLLGTQGFKGKDDKLFPFHNYIKNPFSLKQILILNSSLESRVACVFIPLNYEFGDTEMDMGAVERWEFWSKQQKRVLHPVTLAERAGYSLQRVMQFSTCCCM
jgi:hypothetical protein